MNLLRPSSWATDTPFLNLAHEMNVRAALSQSLYYSGRDTQPTTAGYRAVAEALASLVASSSTSSSPQARNSSRVGIPGKAAGCQSEAL